ncbi:MAG: hypothetical protein IKU79_00275 [Bacteroidaceae bacterium]|nr:hypothetical protein [Bacteroidaceae bacterium]
MNKLTFNIFTPKGLLIAACDITILNAVCILIAFWAIHDWDWTGYLIVANVVSLLTIKYFSMRLANMHWLDSILNRAVKKITDIAISMIFLLTFFPIIFILATIAIRTTHSATGKSILELRHVIIEDKETILMFFRKSRTIFDNPFLNKTPIAVNILLGQLSLWNLYELKEERVEFERHEDLILKNDTTYVEIHDNTQNLDDESLHEEGQAKFETTNDNENLVDFVDKYIHFEDDIQDSLTNNHTSNYEHIQ